MVPVWGIYGAIVATMVSKSLQVIGIYIYQTSIVKISWNLNKLLVFPTVIIIITICIEVFKLQFNINYFVASIAVVLTILGSLVILYKNEIKNIASKAWKQL